KQPEAKDEGGKNANGECPAFENVQINHRVIVGEFAPDKSDQPYAGYECKHSDVGGVKPIFTFTALEHRLKRTHAYTQQKNSKPVNSLVCHRSIFHSANEFQCHHYRNHSQWNVHIK